MRFLVSLLATVLAVLLTACACTAPDQACGSIALGTDISTLPISSNPPMSIVAWPIKGPSADLWCCSACGFTSQSCACAVSCPPFEGATAVSLNAPYTGACATAPETFYCQVWVRDGKVIAVEGKCES